MPLWHQYEMLASIDHTFDKFLGAFAVALYEQSSGQEECSTEYTDKARHVESILKTEVLHKQVVTTVRCHNKVTRLHTHTVCQQN